MIFWLSIIAGGVFAFIAIRIGFYEMWAMLFNIVISIYLAVFLRPAVQNIAAVGDTLYSNALTMLVIAVVSFLVLHGVSYVFLTGQFSIPFPKIFDTLGTGVLGFLAGFLVWSFLSFLIGITPISQISIVKEIGFGGQFQRTNVPYLCWWCNLVNGVVSSRGSSYTTEQAVNGLLEKAEKRTRHESAEQTIAAGDEEQYDTESDSLLFCVPLAQDINAAYARGQPEGMVDEQGGKPVFEDDGVRNGARFGRDTCVHYCVEGNFNRNEGTVMLWFKPDWDAHFEDTLGRILWDMRIEHGSVVKDDLSQRWAIVYPNPAGIGKGRDDETFNRWRFCIATDRNRYIVGTDEKRPDQRTRQAVFGTEQHFKASEWMHLAFTWTRDEGAIFVNGRLDAQSELPEGLPDRPLPKYMQLGAFSSWINAGACGVLADFRIYRKALSQNQILAQMQRSLKEIKNAD